MSTFSVKEFYNIANRYVYAIRGLVMESIGENACRKSWFCWEVELSATCTASKLIQSSTRTSLESTIILSTDMNALIKDVKRTSPCDPSGETIGKINTQI